jgi:hypothetical protein
VNGTCFDPTTSRSSPSVWTNGDVPVPADYDADGKADFAVFRPSSSNWFISQSAGAPTRIFQFGIAVMFRS